MSRGGATDRLDGHTEHSSGGASGLAGRAASATWSLSDDANRHVQQAATEVIGDDRVEYEVEDVRMEDNGERKE